MAVQERALVLLLPGLLLVCPGRASDAATLTVPGTHQTIQAAIDAAASDDVIAVSGRQTGTLVIRNKGNLTITGLPAGVPPGTSYDPRDLATLDFGQAANPIQVFDSGIVVLQEVNIKGARGQTITADGNVAVRVLRSNFTGTRNSGIAVTGTQDVTVAGCIFKGFTEGIRADSNGAVVVQQSEFFGTGRGTGIGVSGTPAVAVDNVLLKRFQVGIAVSAEGLPSPGQDSVDCQRSNFLVSMNTVSRSGSAGIDVNAPSALLIGNDVTGSRGIGFRLRGARQCIYGANVLRSAKEALSIHTTASVYSLISVKGGKGDGLAIGADASENTFCGVGVVGVKRNGVKVEGSDNTFTNAVARKSGRLDLTNVGPGNSFSPGSWFPKNDAGLPRQRPPLGQPVEGCF